MAEAATQAFHRRKYLRLEIHLPVKWTALDPGENGGAIPQSSTTVDIAAGGVSFEANERLEVGTYLEIELSPVKSDRLPLTCRGVVGWCRKLGKEDRFLVGVRLLAPPETPLHRLLLDAYEQLGQYQNICRHLRGCGELRDSCEACLADKNCWEVENPPCCHWLENRDCLHCPVTALAFLG